MQRYEEDGKLPNNKYDIWLTFLNLSDYQSVRLASFRLYHEVAILLNHRFDTANQGIERFAGIRFLGPKNITNLLFGELMMKFIIISKTTAIKKIFFISLLFCSFCIFAAKV